MGYINDTENNLIRLAPDGAGNAEFEGLIETAPSGTNQMVIGFRHYLDEIPADSSHDESGLVLGPASLYWGLSFDGAHIDGTLNGINSGSVDSSVVNLFGVISQAGSSPYEYLASMRSTDAAVRENYAAPGKSGGQINGFFIDGNGVADTNLDLIQFTASGDKAASTTMHLTVPINPTIGATATYWWRIWGSTVDERVFAQMWINTDSIDLSTYDLDDLDNDDPLSSIPASNSWISPVYTINGASEVDTNWRPSSGEMGFPTHWIARWPFETIGIDYVLKGPPLIKYSAIEVV